jgi:hypothetical protein
LYKTKLTVAGNTHQDFPLVQLYSSLLYGPIRGGFSKCMMLARAISWPSPQFLTVQFEAKKMAVSPLTIIGAKFSLLCQSLF